MSNFIPMPDDVSIYNTGTRCDMLQGPCACGATHTVASLLRRLVSSATQREWVELRAENAELKAEREDTNAYVEDLQNMLGSSCAERDKALAELATLREHVRVLREAAQKACDEMDLGLRESPRAWLEQALATTEPKDKS